MKFSFQGFFIKVETFFNSGIQTLFQHKIPLLLHWIVVAFLNFSLVLQGDFRARIILMSPYNFWISHFVKYTKIKYSQIPP
jgi:hypothetical protein